MKMGVIFFKKCIQGVFEDALSESGIDFVCKRQLLLAKEYTREFFSEFLWTIFEKSWKNSNMGFLKKIDPIFILNRTLELAYVHKCLVLRMNELR